MISYVSTFFSTPSWWMPLEWAKALRPTMALFACTGMFMSELTMREVAAILRVLMFVSMPRWWHFRIMAISSSEVLPARSPIPLMVTSTCRAPLSTPARVQAVAMPRSLWQWVERMARSMPSTWSQRYLIFAPYSWGRQ